MLTPSCRRRKATRELARTKSIVVEQREAKTHESNDVGMVKVSEKLEFLDVH
jgi:ribosomal protein L27